MNGDWWHIRSHLALVLAASRHFVDRDDNPELGEAIAMRHALVFSEETDFQKIIMASNLISEVKSHENHRS